MQEKFFQIYSQIEPGLIVVSRPTVKSHWADRHPIELREDKHYNHRMVLTNEVVIEFDDKDKEVNFDLATQVAQRLAQDGIAFAIWFSGSKSTHVHFLLDIKNAKNIVLLKRIVMRHYCKDIATPDLRLAAPNHLIRAEYGLHEKTQNYKTLLKIHEHYPCVSKVPSVIWKQYIKTQIANTQRKLTRSLHQSDNQLADHPGFKYILSSEKFRSCNDGRERALFMLIHVLKPQKTEQELISFCQDWYKYSGGFQLTEIDIERKVRYHYKKHYTFSQRYLYDLLRDVGRGDLVK